MQTAVKCLSSVRPALGDPGQCVTPMDQKVRSMRVKAWVASPGPVMSAPSMITRRICLRGLSSVPSTQSGLCFSR